VYRRHSAAEEKTHPLQAAPNVVHSSDSESTIELPMRAAARLACPCNASAVQRSLNELLSNFTKGRRLIHNTEFARLARARTVHGCPGQVHLAKGALRLRSDSATSLRRQLRQRSASRNVLASVRVNAGQSDGGHGKRKMQLIPPVFQTTRAVR
jgi:hypothetical protein